MLDKKYLNLKESVKLLLDYIEFRCLPFEVVSIESAYNRITYEDILAPENLPGFKRSTVDGFAVRVSGYLWSKGNHACLFNCKRTYSYGSST